MAKKEKKAAAPVAAPVDEKKAAKAAKAAARKEAIKNRPAEQRTNSKQIDVIELGDGNVIKAYGYPVKHKNEHIGVLVTTVALKNGEVVSTSISLVPGDLTIKCKKGHGVICAAKHKAGEPDVEDEENEEEDED